LPNNPKGFFAEYFTTMSKLTQWFFGREPESRRKEKVEITVETKETWDVRWFRQSRAEMCLICRTETIFVPLDLAAQIIRTEIERIENLVSNGEIHFREDFENEKLICFASLKRAMENSSTGNLSDGKDFENTE
jgi:hypothetical protein